jgi:OOP family OmpA-OmpF porin
VNASIKGKVVEFAVDKAEIHTESEAMLDRIGDALKGCSGVVVEISGHTDALGAADKNQTLSEDRAKAVETYLIAKGVPAARLIAKGYGSTKPIEAGVSPAANRKNRRIDFTVSAAP